MFNGITAGSNTFYPEQGRRSLLLCFFLVTMAMLATDLPAFGQRDPVMLFSREYFRSDPFKTSFNAFFEHLTNDPDLENKLIRKKSDTTLFLFSGFYKTYRPMRNKELRTQVIFEQRELQIRQDAAIDTILMYHLVIYADDSTQVGTDLIRREYERIFRRYDGRFYYYESDEVERDGRVVGAVSNFFVHYADMSPVSIGWMKVDGKPQTVLNISMRLRNNGGMVEVPLMLDSPEFGPMMMPVIPPTDIY